MAHHTSYTMGGLCAIGGVAGFASTGSKASMMAGLSLGGLYVLAGYLIANNKDHGIEIATATSLVLVGAMSPRALKTQKPIPAALATLGLATSGYYGFKLNQQINGL